MFWTFAWPATTATHSDAAGAGAGAGVGTRYARDSADSTAAASSSRIRAERRGEAEGRTRRSRRLGGVFEISDATMRAASEVAPAASRNEARETWQALM